MSHLQWIVVEAVRSWLPDFEILTDYRPDWLFGMELDIYVPKLAFCVEVQGRQHSFLTPKFHQSEGDYFSQRRRDMNKMQIAMKRGLKFFIVREDDKRIVGGLAQKIRRNTGVRLKRTPDWLKSEWKSHRRRLSFNARKSVMFKVRKNRVEPINKVSSEYAQQFLNG